MDVSVCMSRLDDDQVQIVFNGADERACRDAIHGILRHGSPAGLIRREFTFLLGGARGPHVLTCRETMAGTVDGSDEKLLRHLNYYGPFGAATTDELV